MGMERKRRVDLSGGVWMFLEMGCGRKLFPRCSDFQPYFTG